MNADNQQGSRLRRPLRDYTPSSTRRILGAYLLGVKHDGTYNKRHKTWRIGQKLLSFLEKIQNLLKQCGYKSWIYREGKKRNFWILETTCELFNRKNFNFSQKEKIAYISGYFDSEGGVPYNNNEFYIQFVQKNKPDLEKLRKYLEQSDIKCGIIHNPSSKVDANYWRFFISRKSHGKFCCLIRSRHPVKSKILSKWMKI